MNLDLFDQITCADVVNHFKTFNYFTEASVVAVEVGSVLTAVTDEKLRTARISSCVRHRQNTAVVVLIVTV